MRQTPPETAPQVVPEPAPPPAATKKPRGYAVKREFADGSDRKPISESEALESIARIMRPAKDDPA